VIRESHILLFSIFIAGLCSIIYELLIATTGAYFLGDSITQFSLTIGIYMAFMGVGSYFSKWVPDNHLLPIFIAFELVLALIGGSSVPMLYFSYAQDLPLQLVSITLTAIIGLLVGLEIPLLSRLMEKHYTLKANLANVLSIDYFGALIATLVFPFFLLPWLGVFKTSLAFGLINLSIAVSLLWYFSPAIASKSKRALRTALLIVSCLLVGLTVFSTQLNQQWNEQVFEDRIVHSEQSQYQQLVMTRHKDDIRLYLNGGLQFSSIDEYRYHEALVHPAMSRLPKNSNILLLGGGDGLAVRELLKYDDVNDITVVDLDPSVAKLARNNPHLSALNQQSLDNAKVKVQHLDGFVFLSENTIQYDLILVDLPDPKTTGLARLYSKQFYQLARSKLKPSGILVTQATSPFFAKDAFWSIHNTLEASGFASVVPYHLNVPSFGEWGFVMACNVACRSEQRPLPATKFYSADVELAMRAFSQDIVNKNAEVSTLDKPNVLYYYLAGWKYWN